MENVYVLMIGVLVILLFSIALVMDFRSEVLLESPYREAFDSCIVLNANAARFLDALSSANPDACKGIELEGFCRAVVNKDASACGESLTCNAMVKGDEKKCGKDIACKAFVRKDLRRCDSYKNTSIDKIGRCKALSSGNAAYFSSEQSKTDCLDAAYYAEGTSTESCGHIVNAFVKSSCQSHFS